jgi:hypothetical protein
MPKTTKVDFDFVMAESNVLNEQNVDLQESDDLKAKLVRHAARQLARLDGTMPNIKPIPRRQFETDPVDSNPS